MVEVLAAMPNASDFIRKAISRSLEEPCPICAGGGVVATGFRSQLERLGGHFVMHPKDAAYATKILHPKFAVPMHYGTTPQLKGTPEEYVQALGQSDTKVIVMKPGETVTF